MIKKTRQSARFTRDAFAGLCVGLSAVFSAVGADEHHIAQTNAQTNAQPNAIVDASVYSVSFFDQYQPQNALEMVLRLPGFSFDEGSSARGFGGNAGNVLIDGSRPTSKSGGLRGALIRIPAGQVVRIEIIRGGISAGEAEGQGIVANVIRSKTVTRGNWAVRARQTRHTNLKPNFEAALSTQIGQWDTSFDTDIGTDPDNRVAIIELRDQDRQLLTGTAETFPSQNEFAFINGEAARDLSGGKLSLNGRLEASHWTGDTRRESYFGRLPDVSEPDEYWTINEEDRSHSAELGIDWASTADDQWKLRLIGLGFVTEGTYDFEFRDQDNNGQTPDSTFSQDRLKTEFVGRATYGKVGEAKLKPEFGIEVDNNRLDTHAVSSIAGVFSAVDGSDVEVEEWRAELFANLVYEASPALSLEAGITGEFSEITVTGMADRQQHFQFVKPRISSTYQFNDQISLRFEAEHRVGQLDFTDFASSAQAVDNRTTAGNTSLTPDQTTELAATLNWSFSERGSLEVKAFREWRSDVLEQIVLSTDALGQVENQGLGNAGDAQTWGIVTKMNLPLDYVIPNGLLEVFYRYRQAEFDDPIIQRERSINSYTPEWLQIDFRQDITELKMAWGLAYEGSYRYDSFLVDEIQTNTGNKRLTFFAETSAFWGVKIKLEIRDFNTGHINRTRSFYDDTRGGPFIGDEKATRTNYPKFLLSVLGSF